MAKNIIDVLVSGLFTPIYTDYFNRARLINRIAKAYEIRLEHWRKYPQKGRRQKRTRGIGENPLFYE
jgi:hypothetical protein